MGNGLFKSKESQVSPSNLIELDSTITRMEKKVVVDEGCVLQVSHVQSRTKTKSTRKVTFASASL